jgi:hypothetical protein
MTMVHNVGMRPGAWLCDCAGCLAGCDKYPNTVLIVKTSAGRFRMPARAIRQVDVQARLAVGGYVREVWVAL